MLGILSLGVIAGFLKGSMGPHERFRGSQTGEKIIRTAWTKQRKRKSNIYVVDRAEAKDTREEREGLLMVLVQNWVTDVMIVA